jgi:hypothetical protein
MITAASFDNILQPLINWAVLAGAMTAVAMLLCRIDKLRYRQHRLAVIVFHGALAVGSIASGHRAWQGDAGLSDVMAVVSALMWLLISWPTWRTGVPPQYVSRPVPLDEAQAEGER